MMPDGFAYGRACVKCVWLGLVEKACVDEREFERVLARLRVEWEELEALRAAVVGLRVFRERLLVVDYVRFD